jgi:hypothetical protein
MSAKKTLGVVSSHNLDNYLKLFVKRTAAVVASYFDWEADNSGVFNI